MEEHKESDERLQGIIRENEETARLPLSHPRRLAAALEEAIYEQDENENLIRSLSGILRNSTSMSAEDRRQMEESRQGFINDRVALNVRVRDNRQRVQQGSWQLPVADPPDDEDPDDEEEEGEDEELAEELEEAQWEYYLTTLEGVEEAINILELKQEGNMTGPVFAMTEKEANGIGQSASIRFDRLVRLVESISSEENMNRFLSSPSFHQRMQQSTPTLRAQFLVTLGRNLARPLSELAVKVSKAWAEEHPSSTLTESQENWLNGGGRNGFDIEWISERSMLGDDVALMPPMDWSHRTWAALTKLVPFAFKRHFVHAMFEIVTRAGFRIEEEDKYRAKVFAAIACEIVVGYLVTPMIQNCTRVEVGMLTFESIVATPGWPGHGSLEGSGCCVHEFQWIDDRERSDYIGRFQRARERVTTFKPWVMARSWNFHILQTIRQITQLSMSGLTRRFKATGL